MDDDEFYEKPYRYIRPETDLSEGNAVTDGTEDLPPLPPVSSGQVSLVDGRPFIWP